MKDKLYVVYACANPRVILLFHLIRPWGKLVCCVAQKEKTKRGMSWSVSLVHDKGSLGNIL